MSLLSSLILPALEKQFVNAEPEIAQFAALQIKSLALELVEWSDKKFHEVAKDPSKEIPNG